MRPLLLVVVTTLLAAWCVFGIVVAVETFGTGCADASSEVSDPCAVGKATYVGFGFLVWCVIALPLCWSAGGLRPSDRRPDSRSGGGT